jgi:hypothetical protein
MASHMAGVSGSEKSDRVNLSSIIGDAACPPRELHRRAGEIPHAFGARLGAARRPKRRGNENPAQASHWGGVPESLGGPWVGGCRRTPEGTYNDRPFIEALQAIGPLTLHQPSTMQRVRLGRRIDVATQGAFRTPVNSCGCASVPPDPNASASSDRPSAAPALSNYIIQKGAHIPK